ncbi:MAG: hypothetical protein K6G63_06330, partial [Eubacterium sp.]|nr:hypothetical protein [Eubacterium sp.]
PRGAIICKEIMQRRHNAMSVHHKGILNIPMRRSRQSGKMEIISPVTGNQLLMRQSRLSGVA